MTEVLGGKGFRHQYLDTSRTGYLLRPLSELEDIRQYHFPGKYFKEKGFRKGMENTVVTLIRYHDTIDVWYYMRDEGFVSLRGFFNEDGTPQEGDKFAESLQAILFA